MYDAPRRMNHDAERRATKFANPSFRLEVTPGNTTKKYTEIFEEGTPNRNVRHGLPAQFHLVHDVVSQPLH